MSRTSRIRFGVGAPLVAVVAGYLYWVTQNPAVGATTEYNPAFNADNFVSHINNKVIAHPLRRFDSRVWR
jgi:hypothetical protein